MVLLDEGLLLALFFLLPLTVCPRRRERGYNTSIPIPD
jgi:hypothetical protein